MRKINKRQIKLKFIVLVKGVNMVALIKLLIGSKIQASLEDIVGWIPKYFKKASPNISAVLPFLKCHII